MKHKAKASRRYNRSLLCCALASCLLVSVPMALAQSTAATVRGQVSVDAAPAADAQVTATNLMTGLTRTVQASPSGSYTLVGLPPGTYRIDATAAGRSSSQTITVQVGQTATLNLGVGGVAETGTAADAVDLERVVVIAPVLVETKTSEIATYVTQKQIEALPQGSRNFLAFADIVPGMQFTEANNGNTSLHSGAQSANSINVFVDGVGQKNYVLKGGVTGQDSSNGNPFPQLAISEYKVITSNYKAELDQVSSAAIVAVTRSGTNEFDGSLFWDKFSTKWRSKTQAEEKGAEKSEFSETHYGAAFGGPIIQDQAHFFITYESKQQMRPQTVITGRGVPVSALPAAMQSLIGTFGEEFSEDLYFGKIDWLLGQDHYFEFTVKKREETGEAAAGGTNTFEHATDKRNDETRLDLRYQFTRGGWLNDVHITHEDATFNPRPRNLAPGYILTPGDQWWDPILQTGGGADFQEKGQKGWSLQNDLTFTGFEDHAFKAGVKFKSVTLDTAEQQPYNPQFYYDIAEQGTPYRVRFGAPLGGIGDGSLSTRNKQFGIYFQDDWTVNDHLTLNLGVRWDYETSPAYTDYVTPTTVLAALNAVDPRASGGQTYAQTLALGGIDINDYISTGNNRKDFKDAFQPRLGFSYDLFTDQRHVIFGGAGRSYDRNLFDWLQLETTKATFPTYEYTFNTIAHPCTVGVNSCLAWNPAYLQNGGLDGLANRPDGNREINMLSNDLKTPYSDQYSIGMRNLFNLWGNEWNSSVTLSHIVSKDGFAFLLGNRRPDGGFFSSATTRDIPWGFGVPGFHSLILGTNGRETRANSLLVSLEKPYTSSSGWGTTLAYTYTDAREIRQFNEHYSLHYPTLDGYGWSKAGGVSPHRLVATGIHDAPFGMTLSGKLTLASMAPQYGTDCTPGWDKCIEQAQYTPSGTYGYKRFDLAVEKQWNFGADYKFRIRADVINVFNWVNNAGYEGWYGAPGDPNPNFAKPTSQLLPTRTLKLSAGFSW